MTDYKYEKCVDCVHAHMDKDGNHDCGFEDCVSESNTPYPDGTPFESYCSCYDCFQKMVKLEKENARMKELLKTLNESIVMTADDMFWSLKEDVEKFLEEEE